MFNKIYYLNNGIIEVYSYNPNNNIRQFYISELTSIDEDERLILKDNPTTWLSPKKDIIYSCGGYVLKKIPKEGISTFDPLEESFFDGEFNNDPIRISERDDSDNDLIYLCPKNDNLDTKIQITKDLYIALLLVKEDFTNEELQKNDLLKYQELFDISDNPLLEIKLSELEKLYQSSIISGNYQEKYNYLENSSKVYSKLKRSK